MTYIIKNPAFLSGLSKSGKTAQEILASAGDVMNNIPPQPMIKNAAPNSALKYASYYSGSGVTSAGANVSMASPSFYSPIHTPINWQVPSKRREQLVWARFFSANNATIKASLRFYSQFPFGGYEHVINDPIRKEHFDNLKKRLRLEELMPQIAYEYFAMGDAFPFVNMSCPECGGWGITKDGMKCNHEGGEISNITILNPDMMDVKMNPLNHNQSIINWVPDDIMQQIVWNKQPVEVYKMIPDNIKRLVLAKQPIPLSEHCVTHLKHDPIPYITYGSSLIAPLFPILAYLDRLRQAQWIVAERHILPIKVVKVGDQTRPAGPQDIADTQRQLAVTANDPKLTLVTHHAFDLQFIGSSGKVLQLTKEYELVDKEIIKGLGVNEALLSGCIPEYSRILTNNGFKTLDEFDQENDLVATLNPETHKFEWGKAKEVFVYEHNSLTGNDEPLVHFKTGNKKTKLDNIFTANHEMYARQRLGRKLADKYEKIRADQIKDRSKFILKTSGWEGVIPENINELTLGLDLETFLKLSGLFISEGSFAKYHDRKKNKPNYLEYNTVCVKNGRTRAVNREKIGIDISQSDGSDALEDIYSLKEELLKKYNINMYSSTYKCTGKKDSYTFGITNRELAKNFDNYFGEYAENKKISNWIKDLPLEYLEILIKYMVMGDGSERIFKYESNKNTKNYSYASTSKKLIEDVFEILIKLQKTPILSKIDNSNKPNHHDLYILYWSPETAHGDYPGITSQRGNKAIKRVKWEGKVWCVNVPPNHLILCENNGKAIWTGNSGPSYSQAALGVEATIKRLKIVQNLFAWWICEKIYKLEAKLKGFYKEDRSGNKILDYPQIRWDDLNLRDETQRNNMFLQLWDKGILSTQTLCEKLNIDYDSEVEKVRMEQQYQLQLGIAPQMKGGKKGGMGSGFGGGLGGLGGGGGLEGNLPGGQSGPGLPGDELAPSMSGGEGSGGMPSGGQPMEAQDIQLQVKNYNEAKKVKPKVHRPNKFKLREPKIPRPEPMVEDTLFVGPRTGQFNLTSIERKLYSSIQNAQRQGVLPMNFIMQQKPEPVRMARVIVDGIFPTQRLIVEADGKQFHSSPEDVQRDLKRDAEFGRYGWKVIRFTEDEINYSIDQVIATIIKVVKELSPNSLEKAASADSFLAEKEISSMLVEQVANLVHDEWRAARDYSPREKEVRDKDWIFKNAGKKIIDLAATEFKDLPKEFKKENSLSATIAVGYIAKAIYDGKEIDNELIENLSSIIHSKWVERNSNADEKLKIDYVELPEEEKKKDRAFVLNALKVLNLEKNQ